MEQTANTKPRTSVLDAIGETLDDFMNQSDSDSNGAVFSTGLSILSERDEGEDLQSRSSLKYLYGARQGVAAPTPDRVQNTRTLPDTRVTADAITAEARQQNKGTRRRWSRPTAVDRSLEGEYENAYGEDVIGFYRKDGPSTEYSEGEIMRPVGEPGNSPDHRGGDLGNGYDASVLFDPKFGARNPSVKAPYIQRESSMIAGSFSYNTSLEYQSSSGVDFMPESLGEIRVDTKADHDLPPPAMYRELPRISVEKTQRIVRNDGRLPDSEDDSFEMIDAHERDRAAGELIGDRSANVNGFDLVYEGDASDMMQVRGDLSEITVSKIGVRDLSSEGEVHDDKTFNSMTVNLIELASESEEESMAKNNAHRRDQIFHEVISDRPPNIDIPVPRTAFDVLPNAFHTSSTTLPDIKRRETREVHNAAADPVAGAHSMRITDDFFAVTEPRQQITTAHPASASILPETHEHDLYTRPDYRFDTVQEHGSSSSASAPKVGSLDNNSLEAPIDAAVSIDGASKNENELALKSGNEPSARSDAHERDETVNERIGDRSAGVPGSDQSTARNGHGNVEETGGLTDYSSLNSISRGVRGPDVIGNTDSDVATRTETMSAADRPHQSTLDVAEHLDENITHKISGTDQSNMKISIAAEENENAAPVLKNEITNDGREKMLTNNHENADEEGLHILSLASAHNGEEPRRSGETTVEDDLSAMEDPHDAPGTEAFDEDSSKGSRSQAKDGAASAIDEEHTKSDVPAAGPIADVNEQRMLLESPDDETHPKHLTKSISGKEVIISEINPTGPAPNTASDSHASDLPEKIAAPQQLFLSDQSAHDNDISASMDEIDSALSRLNDVSIIIDEYSVLEEKETSRHVSPSQLRKQLSDPARNRDQSSISDTYESPRGERKNQIEWAVAEEEVDEAPGSEQSSVAQTTRVKITSNYQSGTVNSAAPVDAHCGNVEMVAHEGPRSHGSSAVDASDQPSQHHDIALSATQTVRMRDVSQTESLSSAATSDAPRSELKASPAAQQRQTAAPRNASGPEEHKLVQLLKRIHKASASTEHEEPDITHSESSLSSQTKPRKPVAPAKLKPAAPTVFERLTNRRRNAVRGRGPTAQAVIREARPALPKTSITPAGGSPSKSPTRSPAKEAPTNPHFVELNPVTIPSQINRRPISAPTQQQKKFANLAAKESILRRSNDRLRSISSGTLSTATTSPERSIHHDSDPVVYRSNPAFTSLNERVESTATHISPSPKRTIETSFPDPDAVILALPVPEDASTSSHVIAKLRADLAFRDDEMRVLRQDLEIERSKIRDHEISASADLNVEERLQTALETARKEISTRDLEIETLRADLERRARREEQTLETNPTVLKNRLLKGDGDRKSREGSRSPANRVYRSRRSSPPSPTPSIYITHEQATSLQKEIQEQEMLLKGYQIENEKLTAQVKAQKVPRENAHHSLSIEDRKRYQHEIQAMTKEISSLSDQLIRARESLIASDTAAAAAAVDGEAIQTELRAEISRLRKQSVAMDARLRDEIEAAERRADEKHLAEMEELRRVREAETEALDEAIEMEVEARLGNEVEVVERRTNEMHQAEMEQLRRYHDAEREKIDEAIEREVAARVRAAKDKMAREAEEARQTSNLQKGSTRGGSNDDLKKTDGGGGGGFNVRESTSFKGVPTHAIKRIRSLEKQISELQSQAPKGYRPRPTAPATASRPKPSDSLSSLIGATRPTADEESKVKILTEENTRLRLHFEERLQQLVDEHETLRGVWEEKVVSLETEVDNLRTAADTVAQKAVSAEENIENHQQLRASSSATSIRSRNRSRSGSPTRSPIKIDDLDFSSHRHIEAAVLELEQQVAYYQTSYREKVRQVEELTTALSENQRVSIDRARVDRDDVTRLTSDYAELRAALETANRRIAHYRNAADDRQKELETSEATAKNLATEKKRLVDLYERRIEDLSTQLRNHDAKDNDAAASSTELETLREQVETLKLEVADLTSRLHISETTRHAVQKNTVAILKETQEEASRVALAHHERALTLLREETRRSLGSEVERLREKVVTYERDVERWKARATESERLLREDLQMASAIADATKVGIENGDAAAKGGGGGGGVDDHLKTITALRCEVRDLRKQVTELSAAADNHDDEGTVAGMEDIPSPTRHHIRQLETKIRLIETRYAARAETARRDFQALEARSRRDRETHERQLNGVTDRCANLILEKNREIEMFRREVRELEKACRDVGIGS